MPESADTSSGSASFRTLALERLERTERNGLRLALLLRTGAVATALVWYMVVWVSFDFQLRFGAIAVLAFYTAIGMVHLLVIGTRYDRWWLKYAVVAVDGLGICAAYALIPVSNFDDVPQILAIRMWGVHMLLPVIALATLSLSWPLVLWAGAICSGGWLALFVHLRGLIANPLTWNDLARDTTVEDYEAVFLSIDFTGTGTRVIEAGTLVIVAVILAATVYRARQVFLAQVRAERDHARERDRRQVATDALGRFVPAPVARRLLGGGQFAAQERPTSIFLLDIVEFSVVRYASQPEGCHRTVGRASCRTARTLWPTRAVSVITYTGDGLLASFNNPVPAKAPQDAALSAAQEIVAALHGHGFRCRIGLAHGSVVAGRIGSRSREAFTVYGETVNIAARLEALAKERGMAIIADDAFRRGCSNEEWRSLGTVTLRGIGNPVDAHALTVPE